MVTKLGNEGSLHLPSLMQCQFITNIELLHSQYQYQNTGYSQSPQQLKQYPFEDLSNHADK